MTYRSAELTVARRRLEEAWLELVETGRGEAVKMAIAELRRAEQSLANCRALGKPAKRRPAGKAKR